MNILAVNPWIHDFAAYDFWLKPYGFLVLLTQLARKGHDIRYIDCLDKKISRDAYGRGKYSSEIIEKPGVFASVPRHFRRYGISPGEFTARLDGAHPDIVLLTCSMTYWYTGLAEAARIIRERFPGIPCVVGGNYATLMPGHLKTLIPEATILTAGRTGDLFRMLETPAGENDVYETLPEYERFYSRLDYAVLRTSWGCPFHCAYCAIKRLSPHPCRLRAEILCPFLEKYAKKGISDFVLYDDAFLYPQDDVLALLKRIRSLSLDIKLHTPNALHLRFLGPETAVLLRETGFLNPHFGLETLDSNLQKKWGNKATTGHLVSGIKNLKDAGYKNGEFSVYMLLGFPGQDMDRLKDEIDRIHSLGARISLAEFSPVPGTKIYEEFADLFTDPLQHNNSIFSFFRGRLDDFYRIKNYVRELNKEFDTRISQGIKDKG